MPTAKEERGVLSEADIVRFRGLYVVDESGCWIWSASKQKFGYGKFTFVRRLEGSKAKVTKAAHYAAFFVAHGRWPAVGKILLHSCDKPSCVNPEHLREGTHAENSADMTRKGRQTKGVDCHKNKLTEDQVRVIRSRYDLGETPKKLAPEFGVTEGSIYFIGKRQTWKHLT